MLDTETAVPGVTVGKITTELRTLGVATHIDGKQFSEDDFCVTADWGRAGKDGATMPGKGKAVVRNYSEMELEAITKDAPVVTAHGSNLGGETLDIYLNDFAYWRNVPERVWNYYIGGYQVIKKWLSYREVSLLGRPLKIEEVEEVTNMVRRIAAILLLEPELNENYQRIKGNSFSIE